MPCAPRARQRRARSSYLRGAFAPVAKEVLQGDLPVEGTLPPALDGTYARVGPNAKFPAAGDQHWFDGDGMVHAVRIKKGKAAYANSWVKTARLKQELRAGRALFPKLGDFRGLPGVLLHLLSQLKERLGLKSSKEGTGPANTALVFHNKQLMALVETDLPYAVRVHGDAHIETLERLTFGGALRSPFTAHPKKDPATGELLGFGALWGKRKPFLHFFVLDEGGRVKLDVPIDVPEPIFVHDMAITQAYAILLDMPVTFDTQRMAKGGPVFDFVPGRAARFGVLPRRTEDGRDVRWFELPALYIFHTVNAWQEQDAVVLHACVYDTIDFSDDVIGRPAHVERIRLDMATGKATRRRVADVACEFPVIPARLLGSKCRYTYVAAAGSGTGQRGFTGLAKIDLAADSPAEAVAGRVPHGAGWVGGEATFVPRTPDAAALKGEDDGYLVTYVTQPESGASEMRVYDAATMAAQPVAAVQLPQKVPLGFH